MLSFETPSLVLIGLTPVNFYPSTIQQATAMFD